MPWNEVIPKFEAHTLRSGGSGKIVRNKDQALAIMESEKKKAASGNTEYAASDSKGHRAMRKAMARRS